MTVDEFCDGVAVSPPRLGALPSFRWLIWS